MYQKQIYSNATCRLLPVIGHHHCTNRGAIQTLLFRGGWKNRCNNGFRLFFFLKEFPDVLDIAGKHQNVVVLVNKIVNILVFTRL